MNLDETTICSSVVFQGNLIRVRKDRALLPNVKTAPREVVEHPGAVAVLPLDEAGRVILVEQFRYSLGKVLLEIPAGKLDPGESARACALRELEEETGFIPDKLYELGAVYTSPGFCDEKIHLYLARGLRPGKSHPDEDEFLTVKSVPFDELCRAVMAHEIQDAKTIAAVLKTKMLLEL